MTIHSIRPIIVLLTVLVASYACINALARAVMGKDWRRSALTVYLAWGMFVWLFSEVLSLFNRLRLTELVLAWAIGLLCMLALLIRKAKLSFYDLFVPPIEIDRPPGLFSSRMLKFLGLCLILMVFILGLIAIIAAPNNWDSMTYHLARVMHWQQDHNLDYYPTHILRQLHAGPWAEMAVLHFQILAGNDRLANFVQFFAMIGCLIGVSYIAKLLGGNREVQLFSSLAVATIPMGILQSTSTQNDYVTALWLVCFVSFALLSVKENTTGTYLSAGASLGLAILTKPTAIVFALPFLIWAGFGLLKKLKGEVWKPVLIIAVAILLINGPYLARNISLFGSPLGPLEETSGDLIYKYTNDVYNLGTLASNVLRNIGLQIKTPFDGLNVLLTESIAKLHALLGLDPNDPRTTWTGATFSVGHLAWHEDYVGNPWHFLMIIISLLLLLRFRNTTLRIYAACLIGGFLLFCLLLKWQPWHSRLHLPLFVLAMPLSILVLSRFVSQRILQVMLAAFLFLALQPLFANETRPALGQDSIIVKDRISQYFTNQPGLEIPYRKAMQHLPRGCSRIGLILGIDSWEYPIWVLGRAANMPLTIEHVDVENVSNKYTDPGFIPCAIIKDAPNLEREIVLNGKIYRNIYQRSSIGVFSLAEPDADSP
jgi:Dolichyl-phosphate-mannose-protein mannosyltransferase